METQRISHYELRELFGQNRHGTVYKAWDLEFNRWVALSLFDEAIQQYHKTIELDPNLSIVHYFLARAYEGKGMYDQAFAEYSKTAELNKQPPETIKRLQEIYAKSGWKAYVEATLEQLVLSPRGTELPPFVVATFYARLDRKDEAMQWLEKGYEERDFRMTLLAVTWEFDNLRSDARFKDLLRRMRLPDS